MAWAVVVGLFLWFIHTRSSSTLVTQLDHDYRYYETILRQELPRYSFVVLYERFPFEVQDEQFIQIQKLEDEYSTCVNEFVLAYTKTVDPNQSDTVRLPNRSALMAHINRMTELLRALYDKMSEYTHLKSDDMQRFQNYSEEVYKWFDDLRRVHQSNLRYM